jgi:glycosyltransferase involved in cell wall biosynthesis
VDGETGWICSSATPQALERALAEVVAGGRDEARRRGLAGRRMAEERFSWNAIAARTAALYDELAP